MPRDCQKLTSQRNQTTSYMKDTGCFNGTNIYTYCGSIKMTTEVSPIGEGGGDPELSPHVHGRYIYIYGYKTNAIAFRRLQQLLATSMTTMCGTVWMMLESMPSVLTQRYRVQRLRWNWVKSVLWWMHVIFSVLMLGKFGKCMVIMWTHSSHPSYT